MTAAERIARAWATDEPESDSRLPSAHPLEYDDRGFPIPQHPWRPHGVDT